MPKDAVGSQLQQTAKKRLFAHLKAIDCVYIIHLLPGRWDWSSGKNTIKCTKWLAPKVCRAFLSVSRSRCQGYVYGRIGRDEHHLTPKEGQCLFSLGFSTVIHKL